MVIQRVYHNVCASTVCMDTRGFDAVTVMSYDTTSVTHLNTLQSYTATAVSVHIMLFTDSDLITFTSS